jgi:ABC-type branched-subunit amino acid transport system permease subunit
MGELINAMCDLRNLHFTSKRAETLLKEMRSWYSPYVPDTFRRFGPQWVLWNPDNHFRSNLDGIGKFFNTRASRFPDIVKNAFDLQGAITVTCKISGPGKVVINGPQGAVGIEMISTFTAGFLLIIFTLIVVLNLVNSRSGRAIMAVRDNRIAAESVGISTTKYRLMAFVVSAALAGMAGALYAMNYSSIVPKKFDFNTSINILVFVVLGGMGNIRGGIISATLLTVLPEKLRFLGDLRMLIYAVVLIMVMLVSNNRALQATLQSVVERVRRRRDDDDLVLDAEKGGDA